MAWNWFWDSRLKRKKTAKYCSAAVSSLSCFRLCVASAVSVVLVVVVVVVVVVVAVLLIPLMLLTLLM